MSTSTPTTIPAPPDDADRPARRVRSGEERTREAGGPDDRAVYSCACGHVFEAVVATDVVCPRCGAEQAW